MISISNKKVDLMLCFDNIFNVRITNGLKFYLKIHIKQFQTIVILTQSQISVV